MGKRLRKAPEGTSSIKSFFTPLGKEKDANNASKSSGSSDSPDEEPECVIDSSDSSDWAVRAKRKRPRTAPTPATRKSSRIVKIAVTVSQCNSDSDDSQSVEKKERKVEKRGRKKKEINGKEKSKKEVDLEIVAFLKAGIPSAIEKLEEIRKEKRKSKKEVSASPEKKVEKEVDLEVIAFLKSGVPTATSKVEKLIDIRRHEEELTKTHDLFPKITHIPENHTQKYPDHSTWKNHLGLEMNNESSFSGLPLDKKCNSEDFAIFKKNMEPVSFSTDVLLCCKSSKPVSITSKVVMDEDSSSCSSIVNVSNLPWIDKYPVDGLSSLAVDGEALDKVQTWLKRWKDDIKDDGGRSRKFAEKRRRKETESDFITSDEDSENKTKSLLLHGPTGTGKSATVAALAKKLGFKIVEVNFSTARSGKDVLRRVEEATLSHRLESSHACLLVFKDICLLEPKEDEGFVAAVAQLITSSCRPIVMTMTFPYQVFGPTIIAGDCDSLVLDSKIEKKDPMAVDFRPQPASVIVKKVLLPIAQAELPIIHSRQYMSTLYSIARHCNGDIRRSINQAQFLLQTASSRAIKNYHMHLSPSVNLNVLLKTVEKPTHSKTRRRIIDPDLVDEDPKVEATDTLSKKSRKQLQEEIKILDALKNQLLAAVDLDRTIEFLERRSHHEYMCDDDMKNGRNQLIRSTCETNFNQLCCMYGNTELKSRESSQDSGNVSDNSVEELRKTSSFHIRSFLFDCDKDAEMERKVQEQYAKLEEYCGTRGDFMASGPYDFDNFAYVRTIIKTGQLNASQKRNRRTSCYFNRLARDIVDGVCETFGFPEVLRISKQTS